MPRFSFRLFRRGLPLLPVAPVTVLLIGIATALTIAIIGIQQLGRLTDHEATLRADAVAATLAVRLHGRTLAEQAEIVDRAVQLRGVDLLVVDQSGQVLINTIAAVPTEEEVQWFVAAGHGEVRSGKGRDLFSVRALDPPQETISIIAFVAARNPPPGSVPLVNAVLALTVILLGVAVGVAHAFTKQVHDDVDFVRARIVDMARPDAAPMDQQVPIRSLDQVGVLTAAFNMLMARFAAAERTYRADLAQASDMDRERSAFLAGLSHELRTPLNAILGFAHILESEVDGPLSDDARESLEVIRTSGEHLRQLIDDILELSALETGTLQLSRSAVDVHQVAEEVVREATATVANKPLTLEVEGTGLLYAFADKRRVRQILTNLVSNATKFTLQGSVTVKVDALGSFVVITVRDTGPGIPREQTAAIFEEYRQLGDARARGGGTGLGLAITKRLVLMHGGTIEVTSEMGRGSTFTVSLPRCEANQAPDGPPPDSREMSSHRLRFRVPSLPEALE